MDGKIQAAAAQLEKSFLKTLLDGVDRGAYQECKSLLEEATRAQATNSLRPETMIHLYKLASRIKIVCDNLTALNGICEGLVDRVGQDAKQELSGFRFGLSPASPAETVDPYLPLRHWFLDHFVNPYPTIPEKEDLMKRYPKYSKQQLDTWFTNIRRRSGWQELKKKYTNGTQEDFENLIKATEKEERTFIVEQCRVMIEDIKGFVKDGGRERVSDSIQEIVKKGAPATSTRRKIQAKQPRGPRGGGGQRISSFASSSSSWQEIPPLPVPFAPSQFTQLVTSPASLYPTPLPFEPRLPSTFSSPTSSLRSVSDSSSSSFDSVLSYGSTSTTASYDAPSLPTIQTPSSPPAMSSLLAFDSPTRPLPSQQPSQLLSRPLPPPIENPYFFTLNNTPLLPLLSQPEPALASSSLAGFASNGDLVV
ncbi:hypothetical protein JCM5353_001065 [Sporobolomyces roseus]